MAVPTADAYSGTPGQPIYGGRSAPPPVGVPNTLAVSLPSGSATGYPLQFGRAFAQGEITGQIQVSLDGTPLAEQQSDVKTRYPDNSVRFAVISVIVPSLGTTERQLSITSGATVHSSAPESRVNMLANYDFEATINLLVGGSPVPGAPASARAMLTATSDSALAANTAAHAVNSRYWTQGPVCTTVILADHTSKTYDMGSGSQRTVRPTFTVEFWPSISRYRVRHSIEMADFEKFGGHEAATVRFTTGMAAPVNRVDQLVSTLAAGKFFSRRFWGGSAVVTPNLAHNVAYLASTKALPNFDSSITMLQSVVDDYESGWNGQTKTLGSNGRWLKGMPNTGGRSDFGILPQWDTADLYIGKGWSADMVEWHSEAFGAFDYFYREGSASRAWYSNLSNGQGRVPTKVARPLVFTVGGNFPGSHADAPTIVGSTGNTDGWTKDDAHSPGALYWSYLSTGQYFWLEKIQQIAAWSLFLTDPAPVFTDYTNGRNSTDMVLPGVQVRGYGRVMKHRGRAWWATPDGAPEKQLFSDACDHAVACFLGQLGIAGMDSDPIKIAWDANIAAYGSSWRPNAFAYYPGWDIYPENADTTNDTASTALWMHTIVTRTMWHLVELGHENSRPLAEWAAIQPLEIVNAGHKFWLTDYTVPSRKTGGAFYQSASELASFRPTNQGTSGDSEFPTDSSLGFPAGVGAPGTSSVRLDTYAFTAYCAIAMANGATGQTAAYNTLKPWYDNSYYRNHDPRYAILPRT